MRDMRRRDRKIDEEQAKNILADAEYCVLSTVGADGIPYGVPLNMVLENNSLYFHSARMGHKLDNMRHEPRVSVTAVGKTQPVYDKDFTTYFESAIAFGTAVHVTEEEEKIHALRLLCEKLLPEYMQHFQHSLDQSLTVTDIWRIDIEGISGKRKAPKPGGM